MNKQTRINRPGKPVADAVDAETLRLSNLQLEFLDLVGIHMGPGQRRALAAAARARGVE